MAVHNLSPPPSSCAANQARMGRQLVYSSAFAKTEKSRNNPTSLWAWNLRLARVSCSFCVIPCMIYWCSRNPSFARLPTDVVREALTSWAAHCCALYATCLTGCLHVVLIVVQQNRYRRRVRPKRAKLGPHTYRGCVCSWNPPVSRAANLPHRGRLGVRLTGCSSSRHSSWKRAVSHQLSQNPM